MSALLGRGGEVTLAIGADHGDSPDSDEGAGSQIPQRVQGGESEVLDVVCAVTRYHRDYARRALRLTLTP